MVSRLTVLPNMTVSQFTANYTVITGRRLTVSQLTALPNNTVSQLVQLLL